MHVNCWSEHMTRKTPHFQISIMIVTGHDTSPLLFKHGEEIDTFILTQFSFIYFILFY